MSRCLSPHPDGWDVKPEVPGDLTLQAFSSLLQTLVSHKSGKPDTHKKSMHIERVRGIKLTRHSPSKTTSRLRTYSVEELHWSIGTDFLYFFSSRRVTLEHGHMV